MGGIRGGADLGRDSLSIIATTIVATRAGAQAMKPPKLMTCGTNCKIADATIGHRFPKSTLASGAKESTISVAAIAKGSCPVHAVIAGRD